VTPLEQAKFLTEMIGAGYTSVRPIRGGSHWAGLHKFMFTSAIIVGRMGDHIGYDDRWCYHTDEDAQKALDAWDGVGEPDGWHRHPGTGRRRQDDVEWVYF
jgi:hypothetical protein